MHGHRSKVCELLASGGDETMQRLRVPLNQLSCYNQQPISTSDLIISGQYATTQDKNILFLYFTSIISY